MLANGDPEATSIMADALALAGQVMQIVGDYNVRSMTPNEMSDMAYRLFSLGAIGLNEYAVMSFQPHMADDYDPRAGLYSSMKEHPGEPRDFVELWEKHFHALQLSRPSPTCLSITREILDLLKSFQPIQQPRLYQDEDDGEQ